jgi:hypothetical protein
MPEESDKPKAEQTADEKQTKELLSELLSGVEDFAGVVSEVGTRFATIHQSRANFCEKLILLNGATLTLMFTVVGGIGAQAHHASQLMGGLKDFKWACALLILSTLLCIIQSQANNSMLVYQVNNSIALSTQLRMTRINHVLSNLGRPNIPFTPAKPIAENTANMKRNENILRFCSVVAELSTVGAYIALIAFFNRLLPLLFQ